jgi:hypothetical protein
MILRPHPSFADDKLGENTSRIAVKMTVIYMKNGKFIR